jgi:hypothetical protein
MLFYTFNLVISADEVEVSGNTRVCNHKQKISKNRKKSRKNLFSLFTTFVAARSTSFRFFVFTRANSSRARGDVVMRRVNSQLKQKKTEEQGKENEWTYIEVSTRYNIIMFIRVFYWLIKVDVINCCLIHNTNGSVLELGGISRSTIWENDIAKGE